MSLQAAAAAAEGGDAGEVGFLSRRLRLHISMMTACSSVEGGRGADRRGGRLSRGTMFIDHGDGLSFLLKAEEQQTADEAGCLAELMCTLIGNFIMLRRPRMTAMVQAAVLAVFTVVPT